jgi:GTPase SAR1 family protein
MIVFDLSTRASFFGDSNEKTKPSLAQYVEEIEKVCDANANTPILIVGNKTDLDDRTVTAEEIKTLGNKCVEQFPKLIVEYAETSAKTGSKVDEAFAHLAELAYNAKVPSTLKESLGSPTDHKKKKCILQ